MRRFYGLLLLVLVNLLTGQESDNDGGRAAGRARRSGHCNAAAPMTSSKRTTASARIGGRQRLRANEFSFTINSNKLLLFDPETRCTYLAFSLAGLAGRLLLLRRACASQEIYVAPVIDSLPAWLPACRLHSLPVLQPVCLHARSASRSDDE